MRMYSVDNLAMENLETLKVMLNMCLLELNYLKENFNIFEEVSAFTLNKISKNWKPESNDPATLLEYGNLCTSLTTVTNLARKLNLHFQLQNEQNLPTYPTEFNKCDLESTEKPQRQISEHPDQIPVNSHTENASSNYEKCSIPPIEETECSIYDSVKKSYKQINLEEFKPNYQITASICYIQNLLKLQFFICEFNTEDASKILQLGKMKHLRQSSKIPSENEIFGTVLDGVIWRAIRCNNSLCEDNIKSEYEAILIDIGEPVLIDIESMIYTLPDEFQQIPAQAIPCILMEDAISSQMELQEQLLKWKYQKVTLEVAENDGNFLYVRFMSDNDDALKFLEKFKETNPFKNDTLKTVDTKLNDSNSEKYSRNGLTEEELEMLYEEPLGTTNAMKAVMGYDPKDEKRICRFYNAKTKSCFKGANCRQVHTLMLKDGWTKDVLPTYNVLSPIHPTVRYDVDTIISITPTYIGEVRQFYCQINDPNYEPLIWNSDEIDLFVLESPPMIFDIVLAKYKDGMWYRAKVLQMDESGKQFKVFYIDYGNEETVHLKNLRRCDYNIAQCPEQAVLCRIVDFEAVIFKKQKQAVDKLRKAVLNKPLSVKVVFHSELLLVQVIDKNYSSLTNEILLI